MPSWSSPPIRRASFRPWRSRRNTASPRIISPRCCAILGRAGIVDSTRGVGGGYRFAGNAKRLTLLDVIRLFEPLGNERSASGEQHPNNAAGRALKLVLDEIDEHAAATFRSITISTMLKIMAQRLASEPTKETRRPRARQDRRGSASRAGGNG